MRTGAIIKMVTGVAIAIAVVCFFAFWYATHTRKARELEQRRAYEKFIVPYRRVMKLPELDEQLKAERAKQDAADEAVIEEVKQECKQKWGPHVHPYDFEKLPPSDSHYYGHKE